VSVDEREFLLRSIRDLDAEFAAGDMDEADYRSLRDEYTARAAAVLRGEPDPAGASAGSAEGHAEAAPVRRRNRMLLAVGGSLVVAGLAAFLIATNSGQRSAGGTITGNAQSNGASPATSPTIPGEDPRLVTAANDFAKGDAIDALKEYVAVLKDNPNNPVALAYEGWLFRLAGQSDQGLANEVAAEKADPSYPDAHFFRGVILLEDKADPADAVKELRFFLSDNPPVDAISRAEVELQQALNADPSVATTVDPRASPPIASNFGPTTTAAPTAP
jgi:tetratricopeptide (TPR) repeat protein